MGREYGALHVRLQDVNGNVDVFANAYKGIIDSAVKPDIKKVADRLGLNIDSSQLPFANLLVKAGMAESNKINTAEHNGFVSVSDRRLTFENIESVARKLSTAINCEVLFNSVHDDSVFVFGMCNNGELTALLTDGECEAYGIEKVCQNIEVLEKYVSAGTAAGTALRSLTGEDMEAAIAQLMGFDLNIDC